MVAKFVFPFIACAIFRETLCYNVIMLSRLLTHFLYCYEYSTARKNTEQYYTLKHLLKDILMQVSKCALFFISLSAASNNNVDNHLIFFQFVENQRMFLVWRFWPYKEELPE